MQVILMSDLLLYRSQSRVEVVSTMLQLPHFVPGTPSPALLQPRHLGFCLGSKGHLAMICPSDSQLFLVQTDDLQKICV